MKKIVTLFTIISVLLSFCSVIPTSAAEPDVKCSFGYVTGTDYGDVWYYEYDAFADYVSKNEGYISFDTEKYDKVFFENNDLWMCPLTESNESSGSRFEVTDIQYNNDNRFYVSTKRTEIGNTDNCVTWMLIIEVTKEYGGLLSAYIYNENNPVVISSLDDLEKLRDSVNSGDTYEGRTVMLAADIDMSEKYGENINGETVSWTPIGAENMFDGTFNGNGHTISGLYINSEYMDCAGVFGGCGENSQILNLVVDGFVKDGYPDDGVWANPPVCLGGVVGMSIGKIANCHNKATITGVGNGAFAAGICGSGVSVENCINTGLVVSDGTSEAMIALGSGDNCKNCYYLMDTSVYGSGAQAKTAEQFECGEVAYLLGGEWGQKIGVDKYPVIGGDKVYFINGTYTNTEPQYPYKITGLRLTDAGGNEISTPEQGKNFIVETDIVKTEERNEKDYLFVAVYDEKGALMNIDYVKAKFTVDGECSFGFNISAQSEPIKEIKAYVWESFSSITPLAESKTLVFSD